MIITRMLSAKMHSRAVTNPPAAADSPAGTCWRGPTPPGGTPSPPFCESGASAGYTPPVPGHGPVRGEFRDAPLPKSPALFRVPGPEHPDIAAADGPLPGVLRLENISAGQLQQRPRRAQLLGLVPQGAGVVEGAVAERIPVILDCDNTMGIPGCDVDDGLALLYLLGSPEVRLLGVTCSYGNSTQEAVCRSTTALLSRWGRQDIPVLRGSEGPDDAVQVPVDRVVAVPVCQGVRQVDPNRGTALRQLLQAPGPIPPPCL